VEISIELAMQHHGKAFCAANAGLLTFLGMPQASACVSRSVCQVILCCPGGGVGEAPTAWTMERVEEERRPAMSKIKLNGCWLVKDYFDTVGTAARAQPGVNRIRSDLSVYTT
jgi:hypothetical protein